MSDRPTTPAALHQWIRECLDVDVLREPMAAGHAAPFDYVCHAFFEGRVPGAAEAPLDAVVWANRGGGKTFLGAVATALDLVFKPGIEVRILAGSLEQASRMHGHLRGLFERPALRELVEGRITERRLRLSTGSGVELLAQSQASVRGTRVQRLRCDEVELFDPEVWEAAQLATRSKACGGVLVRGSVECLSTMHVPFGLMHRLVEEARAGRRRLLRWGLVDVLETCGPEHACRWGEGEAAGECALWAECGGRAKLRAPGGHVLVEDALRMKGRVSPATWRAEMLCLRPRRDDAVLPEFDAREHVVEASSWRAPEGGTWVGGMDFGFRTPTVFLWGVVDEDGVLWVVDERVVAETVLEEHARAIGASSWPRPVWVGVDPAGRQVSAHSGLSSVQVLSRSGLVVRSRAMPTGDGLALVRARLRPADGSGARLFVLSRCARLIESMERYHYPPERPECVVPVKDGFDHAVDALRYLVVNLDRPHRSAFSRY